MRARQLRIWVYSLTSLASGVAAACPRCEAGIAARRQVMDQGFTANLLLATLPFIAVLIVSVLAERVGKHR